MFISEPTTRRQCPTSALIKIAREIWEFCFKRKILISAEYLPGSMNVQADRLSREIPDSSDWQLDQQMVKQVMRQWGKCKMDLFASRWNTQLPLFVSYRLDPDATAVDAFQISWKEGLLYDFPPFCLIGMESFRRQQEARGISQQSANLILKSWRTGTRAAYNSAWNKWSSWCSERDIDPFQSLWSR